MTLLLGADNTLDATVQYADGSETDVPGAIDEQPELIPEQV